MLLLWSVILGGGIIGYFALTLPGYSPIGAVAAAAERHDSRR